MTPPVTSRRVSERRAPIFGMRPATPPSYPPASTVQLCEQHRSGTRLSSQPLGLRRAQSWPERSQARWRRVLVIRRFLQQDLYLAGVAWTRQAKWGSDAYETRVGAFECALNIVSFEDHSVDGE